MAGIPPANQIDPSLTSLRRYTRIGPTGEDQTRAWRRSKKSRPLRSPAQTEARPLMGKGRALGSLMSGVKRDSGAPLGLGRRLLFRGRALLAIPGYLGSVGLL